MELREEDADREFEPEPLGLEELHGWRDSHGWWDLHGLGDLRGSGLTISSRRVPRAHRNAVVRHFRAQGGDEKFNKLLSSWHGCIEQRFPDEVAKRKKSLAPVVQDDVADIIESIVPGRAVRIRRRSAHRTAEPGLFDRPGGEEEDEVGDYAAPTLPSRAAAAWLQYVGTWAKSALDERARKSVKRARRKRIREREEQRASEQRRRTRRIEAVARAFLDWLCQRGGRAPGGREDVVALFRKEARRTEKVKTIDEAVRGLLGAGAIGQIAPRQGSRGSPGINLRSDHYVHVNQYTDYRTFSQGLFSVYSRGTSACSSPENIHRMHGRKRQRKRANGSLCTEKNPVAGRRMADLHGDSQPP